ncbi:MAG: iron-sulfur cluster insertion protein ErpA [Candidatus Makana argininalis]
MTIINNIDIKNLNIYFTDKAAIRTKYLISKENKINLKLRVYINGGGCKGFKYNFVLDSKSSKKDLIIKNYNINEKLIVDNISFQYLIGSSIDYIEEIEFSHFIVKNKKYNNTCSCGYSFSI